MAASTESQGAEEACRALLLTASGVRRKLLARLDQRLERSAFLDDAAGHGAMGILIGTARSVHPDLDTLARQLGQVLVLGPDALSAKHLRVLAQAGFARTARRIGGLARQRTVTGKLSASVRRHPVPAMLAAAASGYAVARLLR